MERTPAGPDDDADEGYDANESDRYEDANHHEDAKTNASARRRRAARWIKNALEPCRAKADKHNLRLLLYLLNMASLEARDISKKPD